jgi:hypothetical protein
MEAEPQSWYQVVSTTELAQGDLLPNIEVPLSVHPSTIEDDDSPFSLDIPTADVVVLTQTCDLLKDEPIHILVAQYDSFSHLKSLRQVNQSDRKQIRRNQRHYYRLLPERDEEPTIGWSVVDFRLLYLVPKQYLQIQAGTLGSRLRLLPPYREALAQGLANYFMRVALDDDLERFDSWQG